jgi:prepilin-type N-terminal cleavage/methylation domain-containing protein
MPLNKFKAFTLVELLVVIAIVGLLSTVVLVSTSGLREQAEIAKTLTWAKSIDSLLGANAVGIYNLNESPAIHGTTISDLSGWGNNGTLTTNDGATNKSAEGVVNGALSFDGVDDYAVTVESDVFDLDASDFTMEGWFWEDSGTASGWDGITLGYHYTSGAELTQTRLVVDDRNVGGSIIVFNYSSPAPTRQWNHIVVTHDISEKQFKAYLNGNPNGSQTYTYTLDDFSPNYLKIGLSEASYYFHGLIDEVRIYNTALTSFQIQSSYYAGLNKLLAKGLMDEVEYTERLTIR